MQFVNWAGDKVLRFVAKRTLKRFLKSLDPKQFNDFSINKGVQLSHLEFETDIINEQILADAPVKVSYGRIGSLKLEWSIQNMTLKFTFSDVDLILDYVPPKQNNRQGHHHESGNGNVQEDILARSLILGNLSRADLTSLEEQPEVKDETESIYPNIDEDDTQSGMIKDLIDKAVQRMRVTVLNGIISVRFPSQIQHDTINILRIEVPCLELRDKEVTEPTPSGGPKTYRKVLTFQSFIVYLYTAKCDADLLSSTLISPRSQRGRSTEESTYADGSKRATDPTADVVCICFADTQNTIDLTIPSDGGASGVGIKLAVFLQSIHCIATMKQLATLRSIFELLSVSDTHVDTQEEGTNSFNITIHVMHLLCAILPRDSGPPPVDVWDSLLDQIGSEPEQARTTTATQLVSPCKELRSEHLLLEVNQLGRSSAVVVRVSGQKESNQDHVSRIEIAFSLVDLRWISESESDTDVNIPSMLNHDITVCEGGLHSRKLADFEPITGKDGEQRPRITVIATTTRDDMGNMIQQIRIRMCPRVLIYSGLLKKFIDSYGCLLSGVEDFNEGSVGRTLSTDSFRSCEPSSIDPSRAKRTYSPRSCSPLSSTSTSDFEDAFHKDNYRRFSANPVVGSPPPYKKQPDGDRSVDLNTSNNHKDPSQHLARSVTFGCSTIHTSQSATSVSTPPTAPRMKTLEFFFFFFLKKVV